MTGSQWQKWDLHVHTPDSFVNHFSFDNDTEKRKYHERIWEKYIDKLETINDINVIGITDYFSLSGYKKILEYRNKGRLKNFQLIIPNIEFRLDILAGKENRRLNYHVIFSEDLRTDIIEREFLQEIHIKAPNSEKRTLSLESISDIGRQLKQQHTEFQNKSDIIAGFDAITVNLKEIQKILNEKKSIFAGKYLLILSAPIWNEISCDGQGHIERKYPFVDSHAVFSSQKTTIEFCLGKKHVDRDQFLKEFGSFKPCIHGSDAHSFDKLCKPDDDRYCWIKAIPTFDGLKQIIFEPEDRVRIQKDNPENYKNVYSLNSVEFYDSFITDAISIVPQAIHFNKNFVAITGGKGSGKTAILDLIANCYVDRCQRFGDDKDDGEDKNSFVQRIQGETDKLGVKIKFIEESIEPFSKRILDPIFIEKSPITYLPQGKIEEISGDRTKLNEKIEEIVFNNEKVKREGYKERFVEIKENTKAISRQLNEYNTKISKLEVETSKEIFTKLNSDKQIADGKLTDLKNQIQKIEANLEEGIQDKISSLKKEIKRTKAENAKCLDIINEINLLKGGIQNFVILSNSAIDNINKKVNEFDIDFQIPEIDVNNQIVVLDSITTALNERKSKSIQEYGEREKSLLELSGEEKTHTKLIKETEIIEGEIKKIEELFKGLEIKKDTIVQFEERRIDEFEKLLAAFLEWEMYYNEVIEAFSLGKSEILGDIQFKSRILFDEVKFTTLANDLFNKKRISVEIIETYYLRFNKVLDDYFKGRNTFDNVKKALGDYLNIKDQIKKTRSKKEFYDWLFGNYFSLNTEIEFRGTSIDKLSMGQKGTVLLKLFLAEGDYPIILDQPEENLDNKFIYNELVGAMRKAKTNRQVLIATNNANLVVNTDAEQIVISEFIDGKITYKTGALESPDIRQEIMPLLEGGPEAFKKREQKYGILGYNI
jgi:energy-coupling factor transporter ATP-binding protein EcfA2